MREVKFLGHVASQEGISIDLTKVEAILQWVRPKNMSDIYSFLGVAAYYLLFVENFFKVATPLTRLTRKDVRFDWNDKCE